MSTRSPFMQSSGNRRVGHSFPKGSLWRLKNLVVKLGRDCGISPGAYLIQGLSARKWAHANVAENGLSSFEA